jgi:hypothetical protein
MDCPCLQNKRRIVARKITEPAARIAAGPFSNRMFRSGHESAYQSPKKEFGKTHDFAAQPKPSLCRRLNHKAGAAGGSADKGREPKLG